MSKERPIIFGSDSVRAILNGKTQTRRVIKPQPNDGFGGIPFIISQTPLNKFRNRPIHCPYGQVGDRLWGKETFGEDYTKTVLASNCGHTQSVPVAEIVYKADGHKMSDCGTGWKPSIHMPRWASRITLEITGIRVERLQVISFRDCEAEGVYIYEDPWKAKGLSVSQVKMRFARLWDSLNTKRGYGWAINPWVWVIEFKL